MDFSGVPERGYSKTDPSWWNALRTAGMRLQAFLGTYALPTEFTIANGQSTTNVTGLSFSGAAIRSFELDVDVYRNTIGGGATEVAERIKLLGVYKTVEASWEMTQFGVGTSGVTFTITAGGQIQYASSSLGGTPATSKMKFKYSTMGV